ncbi:MAG: DEAD/DEAH box helicase, partial [Ilumatobacteraceae bacterium]
MSPTFADLGVPEAVVNVLQKIGITDPFPIQRSTLPDSLDGRDILGRGRTGSGKTLAFALPVVVRLASRQQRPSRGAPRALVLVPT